MKKFSVILLIAVLAITSAFAAFDANISGEVTAKYSYDIDEKSFGYFTPNAEVLVDFVYSGASKNLDAVADGLSAEVKTALTWSQADDEVIIAQSNSPSSKLYANYFNGSYFKFAISAFNIKYKDVWTLNLLKATAVANDFAKSTIDFYKTYANYVHTWDYGYVVYDYAYDDKVAFSTTNGITFTWNGFTFAAGADKLAEDANGNPRSDFYLGVKTPDFNLGKGFTLQGAGAFNYAEGTKDTTSYKYWQFAGALKTAFKSDHMDITLATDQGLKVNLLEKNALKYDADASLVAKFGPAADFAQIDAYFGRYISYYDKEAYEQVDTSIKNLLSAKVAFDFNAFGAPVKASVAGKNVLNNAKILDADAEITIADNYVIKAFGYDLLTTNAKLAELNAKNYSGNDFVDEKYGDKYYFDNGNAQKLGLATELTFGPVVVDASVYTRLAEKRVGFTTGVEYTNKYFVAEAEVGSEFVAGQPAKNGLVYVGAAVEAENTIIKNATLGLKYASDNLLNNTYGYFYQFDSYEVDPCLGTVKAYVTVAF